jgi:hypothetical protein
MRGLERRLDRIERQLNPDNGPVLRIPAGFFGDDKPFDMPNGFVELKGYRTLLDLIVAMTAKEQLQNETERNKSAENSRTNGQTA